MTKTSRPATHRPSLGRIARALPEAGSKEARLLSHVLKCELCTDAALSILEIGNRKPGKKAPDYEAAIEAAEVKARRLFEQGMHAMAFAEELFAIHESKARQQRTLELARVEPWPVAESLLAAAEQLLDTDPHRAGELAKLAAGVAAAMDPEAHPATSRGKLFARAHQLLGESLFQLHERAEQALDRAERRFAEATGIEPYPFSIRATRRRRKLEPKRESFDA